MLSDILILLVAAGLAYGATLFLIRPEEALDAQEGPRRLKAAEAEARRIAEESAERLAAMQKAFEMEERSAVESSEKSEKLIAQKEEMVKRREERNKGAEDAVAQLKQELTTLAEAKENLIKETVSELGKRSKLSPEKALEEARSNLEQLVTYNAEGHQKQALEDLEEDAQRHAKSILQIVIQRLGVPSSVDKNNTSVTVKDDKFKGLLVGKNGSNVQYLESLLPVSVIFNLGDAETIHVGGVNLIRRNIAKRAIEKMQTWVKKKGSLDHEMIKQAVEEADKEIMELCDKKGTESLKLMGLDPKQTPAELINYIGRLYLRTSNGPQQRNGFCRTHDCGIHWHRPHARPARCLLP
jgi:ribonuclease Y